MLTDICQELKNWFVHSDNDKHIGTFKISDGIITPSTDLKDGQYFRIIGSVFNDGVHQYGDSNDVLIDEEFDGAIWNMYIPSNFLLLCDEISEYESQYGEPSPYSSESFGGYSYSRQYSSWKDAFGTKLNGWRKL